MTFAPRIVFGSIDLTATPYMVEFGFDLDSPKTVYDIIASLMVDGSNVTSTGHSNREALQIPVLIEWPDSFKAAQFAEALELEVGKSTNTLTFYPGDAKGFPTVLETFVGAIDHAPDQDLEQSNLRRYILTLPALPFARSVDSVSFTWTGTGRELNDLSSLTGWTTSTAPTLDNTVSGPRFDMATNTTLSRSILADNYLWLQLQKSAGLTSAFVHDITVNGEAVSSSTVRFAGTSADAIFTIPTERWQGQTVTVSFVIDANGANHTFLKEFWAVGYPNMGAITSGSISRPKGLDVVDVLGSARTPCTLTFTAPAGGAFVYTAPDPNAQLRQRGVGEVVFGKVTVTDAAGAEITVGGNLTYFPQGDHQSTLGMTAPQPLQLNTNGVYPAVEMKSFTATGTTGGFQYSYPTDTRAAISFFTTTGAKTLISPTPTLPQGYRGDAVVHTPHLLYPGRCGFGVFDTSGNAISTTVTYYPRNWIYAAH